MTFVTDNLQTNLQTDPVRSSKRSSGMTFEEYLNYDDGSDTRYELVKGELVAMSPPTWLHFLIVKFLERTFEQEIQRLGDGWEVFRECGQQTSGDSARLPDLSIVPFEAIECALDQSAVLTIAAILVVEVVSESTAAQDYREKVQEYQEKGIREYWIVDADPFGAAKYIGSPKRPTVSVYHWIDGVYQVQRFQGDQPIVSPTFPELNLTADQVLGAGR
jgi:Uma2 family endonuclease